MEITFELKRPKDFDILFVVYLDEKYAISIKIGIVIRNNTI
jgi:hypothetical protein